MILEIDLSTGVLTSDTLSDAELSGTVIVHGMVERIRDACGTTDYPAHEAVERYVLRVVQSDSIADISRIEGRYLILCKLNETIHVFCDKFSLARIYYRLEPRRLIISDALLGTFKPLSISCKRACQFLFFRFVPGRYTLFENVFMLMPGECLTIDLDKQQLKSQVYATFPYRDAGGEDENESGTSMHECFRDALDRRISRYATKQIVVPLSGGLDSRYILACLLELVQSERITAVTYGSKGTYDYEIGAMVARAAGVRHVAFSLQISDYSENDLRRNLLDSDGQINFITEAPLRVFEEMEGLGEVIVSGYVGDTVMGAKAHEEDGEDRLDIVIKDGLVPDAQVCLGFMDRDSIGESFYYQSGGHSCLTAFEDWFFSNHFTKYSNLCVFKNRMRLNYVSPFIDYAFCELALGLPFRLRKNKYLYRKEFCRRYPRLAALPLKSHCGAAVSATRVGKFVMTQKEKVEYDLLRIDRRANYIDFRKHMSDFIDRGRLRQFSTCVLGPKLTEMVFGDKRCAMILYNLRCLEMLSSVTEGELGRENRRVARDLVV